VRRVAALLTLSTLLVVTASAVGATRFVPPRWLLRSQQQILVQVFENAKPRHVYYIPYPRKIAVIFEFDRVVICGLCSSPSSQTQPRGKVIRVGFDRQTHGLGGASGGWAMRFCEADGKRPPKSACLRR
jgi:hypothetical protein